MPTENKMLRYVYTLLIAALLLSPCKVFCEQCQPALARVIAIEGSADYQLASNTNWQTLANDNDLCSEVTVRVGSNSRVTLVLDDQTLVRLDNNTTLRISATQKDKGVWANLQSGVALFISRVTRSFTVATPFANAGIEGTEFLVAVSNSETIVTVFEGRVRTSNNLGEVLAMAGQTAIARASQAPVLTATVNARDAVKWALYYPPILSSKINATLDSLSRNQTWRSALLNSLRASTQGNQLSAIEEALAIPDSLKQPALHVYRASLYLAQGQTDSADDQLKLALALDPAFTPALAQQAIGYIVRGEKEKAQQIISQPTFQIGSVEGALASSYLEQAYFNLDKAISILERSLTENRDSVLLHARLAELYLADGQSKKAITAANKAIEINPTIALPHTILGYSALIAHKRKIAEKEFVQASKLEPQSPLTQLGLGLLKIQSGNLEQGRRQIEIAATLDPTNSLIRSYLGKAYYEENRSKQASEQFSLAKDLDAKDPTPWLYQSVLETSANNPIAALKNLEQSIALNEKRAPYRSKFFLEQDLATRNVNLARTYDALGFEDRALYEGYRSLAISPASPSAHRFLADSYLASQTGNEISRVSELLQAQLLEPLNTRALQPQLIERDVSFLNGTGPIEAALNEYNELYVSNGSRAEVNTLVGSQSSFAEDVVVSGLYDNFVYSVGQFHYTTDGFRDNNQERKTIYNVFMQSELDSSNSVQTELRFKRRDLGDSVLNFNQNIFSSTLDKQEDTDSVRFGSRHQVGSSSVVIASIMHARIGADNSEFLEFPDFPEIDGDYIFKDQDRSIVGELQHLYSDKNLHLVSGLSVGESRNEAQDITPLANSESTERGEHKNLYLYAYYTANSSLNLTSGLSFEQQQDPYLGLTLNRSPINPKLGASWNVTDSTTLRLAAFKSLKRQLINDQTIEPTQIVGFNQFFDQPNGTKAWTYATALDQKLSDSLFAGVSFANRNLSIPIFEYAIEDDTSVLEDHSGEEREGRAYLGVILSPLLSVRLSHIGSVSDFNSKLIGTENFSRLRTQRTALRFTVHSPTGLFAFLEGLRVSQSGDFSAEDPIDPDLTYGDNDTVGLINAGVGYRLPKNLGVISLELQNMADEEFQYQQKTAQAVEFAPDQTIMGRVRLHF